MKIPFKYMPASWGLVGDAYLEAEAHYLLIGEALEQRLIDIRHPDDEQQRQVKKLDLALKYGRLTPYDHACQLLDLQCQDKDERWEQQLAVDVQFGRITPYDAAVATAQRLPEGVERSLALLDVAHRFDKLGQHAYDKQVATVKNQPWVAIVDSGFDATKGVDGVFFELDWNPQWVEFLKQNGFTGQNDDQIVDEWFFEVCRSYARDQADNVLQLPLQ